MHNAQNYQRIWRTAQLIPYGKVASYGQVADLAGLPGRARLVGKALGFVPLDMSVPWYRILRSNGQIAFPLGSEHGQVQRALLISEGVLVKNNRVALTTYQWQPDLAEMLFRLDY